MERVREEFLSISSKYQGPLKCLKFISYFVLSVDCSGFGENSQRFPIYIFQFFENDCFLFKLVGFFKNFGSLDWMKSFSMLPCLSELNILRYSS